MELSDLRENSILTHLEEILASPAFCSSPRASQFLRYVVESALAGEKDSLKERVIGERVFGRPPDYDTGQDAIVRVKASEVRRRLAQYYDDSPDETLRIELPAGSYVPWFNGAPAVTTTAVAPELCTATEELPPAARKRDWRFWTTIAAVPLALAAVVAVRSFRPTPFDQFWAPFLDAASPPILCLPTPERFRIVGADKPYLIEKLHPRPPEEKIAALSVDRLQGLQIVPETGLVLSLGDAHALTLLYSFAAQRKRTPQVRIGNETTFTELRDAPVVLIGAFTNRWTHDLMKDARFAFAMDGTRYGIRDNARGEFVYRKPHSWEPRSTEDWGVITRLRYSKTGQPLLVAAGLDHYGTMEAGELLTRRSLLERALKRVPAGWQDRNLQILYRVEIVQDNVASPKIEATFVW